MVNTGERAYGTRCGIYLKSTGWHNLKTMAHNINMAMEHYRMRYRFMAMIDEKKKKNLELGGIKGLASGGPTFTVVG